MNKLLLCSFVVLSVLILGFDSPQAHEPIFGIGPHTIYKNGIGLELEIESDEQAVITRYELIYGITSELSVTMAVPYLFLKGTDTSGIGDVVLRGKYRLFRRDQLGASNQVSIVAGIKLPSGGKAEGLGSVFVALAAGRESRRFYYFADVRYRLNPLSSGGKWGDVFNYDFAYGIRPWRTEYKKPDLVVLVEINGEIAGSTKIHGHSNFNSDGYSIALAPGFLFSYRNVMLKGAVKLPVVKDLNQREYVLAIEFHL